ncbi:MAG TPA: hypothetical protein VL285_12760 [Bryobacteraceae bacterium]|jgi:hypothetical protein|nr:hypothetical protein [Bryobacteraceae bacterium]
MVSTTTALRLLKHDRDAGRRALLAAAQIETADQILYLKAHLCSTKSPTGSSPISSDGARLVSSERENK